MDHSSYKLSELAFKYLQGELDAVETEELNSFLAASEDNRLLFEQLTDKENIAAKLKVVYSTDAKAMWNDIATAVPKLQKGKTIIMRPSLKYAAAVILVAALGSYFYFNRHPKQEVAKVPAATTTPVQNDVLPGGNKATLTLADGSIIALDSAADGSLAKQGSTEIVKTSDGKLAYSPQTRASEVYYNTVTTPKGGQFQLTLPDGTKIWMNAASSLRFPTAFTGKERLVELDGEAYFEVAKNPLMPFIVQSKTGLAVQVLGTHFNVMAYGDEQDSKATLIEGSVKVSNGSSVAMLKPGQQAITKTGTSAAGIRINKNADIEEAIAWKNGRFQFNNADLETVMRQLERWYDIEIVYEGTIPKDKFMGEVGRNLTLSEALKVLERTGVQYKVEGRKLIVKQQ